MMLVPSLLSNNFVDSIFDDMSDMFAPWFRSASPASYTMSTDIQDLGDAYQLDIELPGYKKEEIHANLCNGYLTVAAKTSRDEGEKDEKGNYIRRERYMGSCQRSFYVGENLKEEDIKANFENGILKLTFPKEEKRQPVEERKYISIE